MILKVWVIISFLAGSSVYNEVLSQGCYPCNQYYYNYDYPPPYVYFPKTLPIPEVVAPLPVNNNSTSNNSTNCQGSKPLTGNSLYLLFDQKTQSLSIQVTPPCNKTNNTGSNPPKQPTNTTAPGGGDGASGPDTGVCSTITLIKQIVDGLANIINSILSTILDAVIKLLSSVLNLLVVPLLDTLTTDIESLLKQTLLTTIKGVETVAITTLNGLLGSESLVTQLLTDVDKLLGGQPGAELANLTINVNKLLNDTVSDLLTDVESIVKDLFDPTLPATLIPTLTQNITSLVNSTLQTLLNDLDTTVIDLLNGTLGNQSLVTDITNKTEILLTDVLNTTICDLQKLLNETESLPSIITNIVKLVDDLVTDLLQDLGGLLSTVLKDVLGDPGILKKLLEDLTKLLSDVLLSLLGQRMDNMPTKKPDFKEGILKKLTQTLTSLLATPSTPSLPSSPTDALPSPDSLPSPTSLALPQVLPQILKLVEDILDKILGAVNDLVKQLLSGTIIKDPISTLLGDIEKLLTSLLGALLGGATKSMTDKLSNPSGLIDLPALTSPIGTLVTNVLRTVFQCNVSCTPSNQDCNNTSTTPVLPPSPCSPNCNFPPFANSDCSNTVDQFLTQLQQYESTITQQFSKDFYPTHSSQGLADSLLNEYLYNSQSPCNPLYEYDDSVMQALPESLLQGVNSALHFTSNAATNGLLTLVNSVAQNANSSDSLTLPIL